MNWLNRKEGMNVKMYHKILKEVINKLNQYKLASYISDVQNWINSLSSVGLKNFLSLDILPTSCILSNNTMLINPVFLESKYFSQDKDLINKASLEDIKISLLKLAGNKESIRSLYHEADMLLIYNSKTRDKLISLTFLAQNNASLLSEYHLIDMNLISNSKIYDTFTFFLIEKEATNKESLDNPDHEKRMKSIIFKDNQSFEKMEDKNVNIKN